MPARHTAAAVRAAVAAAAHATRGLEAALRATASDGQRATGGGVGDITSAGKPDGRKMRWHNHKEARRTELVDGTLAAVRQLGPGVGMDEIAGHIGISKTVLYRYFTDKNDLNTAAMVRFIELTLIPRLTEALVEDVDEYTLTRAVITVYVQTIADEPAVYTFVTGSSYASPRGLADSERLVAQLVALTMHERLGSRGVDVAGFETWAYMLVGGVQLATHWWMIEHQLTQDALIDHLTMLVWTSFVGIAEVGGSAELFNAGEHPFPQIPTGPV